MRVGSQGAYERNMHMNQRTGLPTLKEIAVAVKEEKPHSKEALYFYNV